jgi:C4-type Zn-finger protein
MISTAYRCYSCHYEDDDIDSFYEIEGKILCYDCNDDTEVVRECEDCGYRSLDFKYVHSIEVSEFETAYICDDCISTCSGCCGRGCNNCLMTGF